jgi:ubiquinone/menaquinone biosynthesis C-methylase UbiE
MSINQKIFDKDYYYNICLGSEEFKNSGGILLHKKVKQMIDKLEVAKTMNVLEIGCGRGDTALYIARKVNSVHAIDYSLEGIRIAKNIRKKYPKEIQKKIKFAVMKATDLAFKNDQFDLVLLIDVIDHLNKKEQEKTMKEISRVLKKNGKLFIRTCANSILLSFTYKYYIYPVNRLLTWLDKKIKHIDYASLPQDPRTREQKRQHINEPDYYKLQTLFKKYRFSGSIHSEVGFLKERSGIRTDLYNFAIAFYPFSKYYPLNILFTGSFICTLHNNKPATIKSR